MIARRLSHELGVPFVDGLIVKADTSFHQHDQSVRLRRELADLVYMANADARCAQIVKGKTVLVCDDIVTTGSTLSKCAKVLKDEGASKVYAAALAG